MIDIRLKFSAVLLLGLGLTGLKAQTALPTTGGNASGSGGSVNYTIGQVVYSTNIGSSGCESQGVQQPFEISVFSGVDEVESINLLISVYPNPTTDFLTLKIDESVSLSIHTMYYQLYDVIGKQLEIKRIDVSETCIAMSNLKPSIYFLKINQNNKSVKTFKIVKN